MDLEEKLRQLGCVLAEVPKPLGLYLPALQVNDILFLSGVLPEINGEIKYKGKLGKDLTIAQGYEAAKICALNALSVANGYLGGLSKIRRIVKVIGYFNSAPGFNDYPKILNGASELLINLLGDNGRHVRFGVGVADVVRNACMILEILIQIKTEEKV